MILTSVLDYGGISFLFKSQRFKCDFSAINFMDANAKTVKIIYKPEYFGKCALISWALKSSEVRE